MSKNREGMHKEWHTKRINLQIEIVIEYIEMLFATYDWKQQFGDEVDIAMRSLLDALYKKRNSLDIQEYVGSYVVEYGYNWVLNIDNPKY